MILFNKLKNFKGRHLIKNITNVKQNKNMNKIAKIIIWVIVIIIIIVGIYLLAANQKSTKTSTTGPIKIGFIGPLSGDTANIGLNSQAAVEIAVDEVNKAGGINGRQIQMIYEDGQCSGLGASKAANKLINVDNVPIIFGGACSGETASFTGAARDSKTIVFSYCSSAPSLSNTGDFFFRDYPSDSYQGNFGADYIFNKLGKKNAAVLYVQTDYGVGLKDVFENTFKGLGGNIVDEEGYDQNSRDLRAQLTKIKAAKPDIVYFVGYAEASTVGVPQAKQLGLNVPLFGTDSWDDSKIWSSVGSAGDGDMYTIVSTPLSDNFKAAMKAKLGKDEITDCSAEAYDGIKVLAQAIASAGGTDYESLKNALHNIVYTGGVSSDKIQFDNNGDLVGANYIIKVAHNGVAAEAK